MRNLQALSPPADVEGWKRGAANTGYRCLGLAKTPTPMGRTFPAVPLESGWTRINQATPRIERRW
jgi:hypothetical protein